MTSLPSKSKYSVYIPRYSKEKGQSKRNRTYVRMLTIRALDHRAKAALVKFRRRKHGLELRCSIGMPAVMINSQSLQQHLQRRPQHHSVTSLSDGGCGSRRSASGASWHSEAFLLFQTAVPQSPKGITFGFQGKGLVRACLTDVVEPHGKGHGPDLV